MFGKIPFRHTVIIILRVASCYIWVKIIHIYLIVGFGEAFQFILCLPKVRAKVQNTAGSLVSPGSLAVNLYCLDLVRFDEGVAERHHRSTTRSRVIYKTSVTQEIRAIWTPTVVATKVYMLFMLTSCNTEPMARFQYTHLLAPTPWWVHEQSHL